MRCLREESHPLLKERSMLKNYPAAAGNLIRHG